ncbi:MAG: hypothetical protein HY817_04560 [Candidatus Abawacabacteria bacterium]|nr:hypothetical protein [Candidatus Abawacabacteria bacterium]
MSLEKSAENFVDEVLADLESFIASGMGRPSKYADCVKERTDEAVVIIVTQVREEFSFSVTAEKLSRLLAMLHYLIDLDPAQNIPRALYSMVKRILLAVHVDTTHSDQVKVYKELFFCIWGRQRKLFGNGIINEIRWALRYGTTCANVNGVPSDLPAMEWVAFIRAYCEAKR